ncbi:MAG: M14 family zinc carboxypeptidase [Luteimonas sp.]
MRLGSMAWWLLPTALLSAGVFPRMVAAAPAAEALQASELPLIVSMHYRSRAQLQSIAARFEHPIVDRKTQRVRIEATQGQVDALRREGFDVAIDADATAQLQRIQSAMRAASAPGAKSIPGFACYRTVEETYATIDDLVALKPGIAQVANIGPTWQRTRNAATGYDMKVLKLTNRATDALLPNKPTMVVFGSIHAREYAPAELLTRFAEWLVMGYGVNDEATWLLDNFSFHLVLQANPDGRKKAETGLLWRKNTDNSNGSCPANSVGVDLNRNFPFHWNTAPGGSSGNACDETYRGPITQSEPETQNLFQLVAGAAGPNGVYSGGLFPDRRGDAVNLPAPDDYQGMFIDLHSAAELVLWSWGDTANPAPNSGALRTLGRRLAYLNHYYPQQSDELYATDGTTDDTMYGLLGVPSFTVELDGTFFESCSTFQNTTSPDNIKMLRYAARSLYAPYKYPSGPDTTAIGVSATTATIGTPITVTATVSDAVFSQVNGTEPVQAIASANAYLDAPPWSNAATVISLIASDGAFNSSSEAVAATIATGALSAGVHTLYVQGTDAAGKPGTPNTVRFTLSGIANTPPTADFTSAISGLTVHFTDTSTDPDGTVATRSWSFGDGTASAAAAPVKTYAAAGTYSVTLTVTDDDGATATKSKSIVVSVPGDVPQTYRNDSDYPIVDNATTNSTIVVTGRSGDTRSALVMVGIAHTRRGDLTLDLIASDGSVHRLRNPSGGTGDDIAATYKLALLPGRPRNGNWTLRVRDGATGDTGKIDSWSIAF